jgi:hypothetical protein
MLPAWPQLKDMLKTLKDRKARKAANISATQEWQCAGTTVQAVDTLLKAVLC